jgi:predicted Zn-dependent protease
MVNSSCCSLGGAALGAGDSAIQLADAIGQVTFQLPHSREQKSEADQIGIELMARAGYDPQAAISVWEKMTAANSSGHPPSFLALILRMNRGSLIRGNNWPPYCRSTRRGSSCPR